MAVSWSAPMDQRLLLAVIAAIKFDHGAVAKKWKELFGHEEIKHPTARAVKEHIIKLKSDLGIASSAGRSSNDNSPISATKSHEKAQMASPHRNRDDTEHPLLFKSEGTPTWKPNNSRPRPFSSAVTYSTSTSHSPKGKTTKNRKRSWSSVAESEADTEHYTPIVKDEGSDDEYHDYLQVPPPGDPLTKRLQRSRSVKSRTFGCDSADVASSDSEADGSDAERAQTQTYVQPVGGGSETDECIVVATRPSGSRSKSAPLEAFRLARL